MNSIWGDSLDVVLARKGGAGSGYHGPRPDSGRSGLRGGSEPRKGIVPNPEQVYVGVTTSRPEKKDPRQIERDMRDFIGKLRALGVPAVYSRLGRGAWVYTDEQGQLHVEDEPTWVLRYKGNGKALDALAHLGRTANQDAVLVVRKSRAGNPNAARRYTWSFGVATPQLVNRVNQLAGQVGLGGWTWDSARGKLHAVGVRQWGDPKEHDVKARRFDDLLRANGISPRLTYEYVETLVMEREGENAYERWYRK